MGVEALRRENGEREETSLTNGLEKPGKEEGVVEKPVNGALIAEVEEEEGREEMEEGREEVEEGREERRAEVEEGREDRNEEEEGREEGREEEESTPDDGDPSDLNNSSEEK